MVTMEGAAEGEAAGGLALDALRFGWGDAYEITAGDADAGWTARRRDGKGGAIEAPTADDLHRLIVENYTFMPVPRDLP
jgi:hypothetical protein